MQTAIGALVWLHKSGTALGSVAAPCLHKSREANKANVSFNDVITHHLPVSIGIDELTTCLANLHFVEPKMKGLLCFADFPGICAGSFSSLLVRISWQLNRRDK